MKEERMCDFNYLDYIQCWNSVTGYTFNKKFITVSHAKKTVLLLHLSFLELLESIKEIKKPTTCHKNWRNLRCNYPNTRWITAMLYHKNYDKKWEPKKNMQQNGWMHCLTAPKASVDANNLHPSSSIVIWHSIGSKKEMDWKGLPFDMKRLITQHWRPKRLLTYLFWGRSNLDSSSPSTDSI